MFDKAFSLTHPAVLIVYDTILTFDIELQIIWRRKFTLVSVLYVLNRYGQAVYYTLAVVLLLPLTDSAYVISGRFDCVDVPLTMSQMPLCGHRASDRCVCAVDLLGSYVHSVSS